MNIERTILILALLCLSGWSMAQPYVSSLGRFEVDQVSGCAPLTVNVTIRPPFVCNGANPCDMDFENNNQFQALTFSHVYTQPGTYTLRILFQTSGFDQITITVAPNTPPVFEIYSCGNNAAQVRVTDTNYDQYVINYNDATPDVIVPSGSLATDNHTFGSSGNKTITVRGRNLGSDDNCNPTNQVVNALVTLPAPTITQLQVTDNASIMLDFSNQQNILYKLEIATNSTTFQQLQNVYNTNTVTVGGLRPDDNYYCFRLGAFDPCNNITVYSNIICSADLDVTALSGLNHITWATNSTGVSSHSISKSNSAPIAASPAQSIVDDTNVVCGTDYCYRLTTTYGNGSQSISLEKCVTAFSDQAPATIEDISARISGTNNVELLWVQDPSFSVTAYDIFKGGQSIGTSSVPSFIDGDYSLETQLCYTISYSDACGNKSLISPPSCPINLAGNLQQNNVIDLTWSAYSGWKNGVDHYVVEKYSEAGQLLQTFDTGTSTSLQDAEEDLSNQVYLYRVLAYAVDAGIIESISNTITVIKEPNLFHPNTFTPNSDGLNDTFKVFGQYTAQVEFKIFNRWGELLFITEDLNQGWDGTYKGNGMPEGTYVFRAYLTDLAGRTFERSGNVLLLRKGQ